MSQQAMVLLTQKAGNDDVSILTPRVILPQPPVLNVDVPSPNDDVDNDTSNVSSDVSSAGTSTGGGTLLTGKEMTVAGDVEGEYHPLPDDYFQLFCERTKLAWRGRRAE